MAVQKILFTDLIGEWATKYNASVDEIITNLQVNGGQLELEKFGGGVLSVPLPSGENRIIDGMVATLISGDTEVNITSGAYQIEGVQISYPGGTFPIPTITTDPKQTDAIIADIGGVLTYVSGTPESPELPPALGAGQIDIKLVQVGGDDPTILIDRTYKAPYGYEVNQVMVWDGTKFVAGNVPVALPPGSNLGDRLAWDGVDEYVVVPAPKEIPDGLIVSDILQWNGALWQPKTPFTPYIAQTLFSDFQQDTKPDNWDSPFPPEVLCPSDMGGAIYDRAQIYGQFYKGSSTGEYAFGASEVDTGSTATFIPASEVGTWTGAGSTGDTNLTFFRTPVFTVVPRKGYVLTARKFAGSGNVRVLSATIVFYSQNYPPSAIPAAVTP